MKNQVANKHEKSLNFTCYPGNPNLKTMYDQQLKGLRYTHTRECYTVVTNKRDEIKLHVSTWINSETMLSKMKHDNLQVGLKHAVS